MRAAFLAAVAMPFLRSHISAPSISPLASERAFLQSIMGAPLRSRNSFTCAAEMLVVSVLIFCFLHLKLRFTTFDPRGSSPDAGHQSSNLVAPLPVCGEVVARRAACFRSWRILQ